MRLRSLERGGRRRRARQARRKPETPRMRSRAARAQHLVPDLAVAQAVAAGVPRVEAWRAGSAGALGRPVRRAGVGPAPGVAELARGVRPRQKQLQLHALQRRLVQKPARRAVDARAGPRRREAGRVATRRAVNARCGRDGRRGCVRSGRSASGAQRASACSAARSLHRGVRAGGTGLAGGLRDCTRRPRDLASSADFAHRRCGRPCDT